MYFVIETIEQLNKLPKEDECFVQVITGNYNYHPKLTYPSLYYYRNREKGYILCHKHTESLSITEDDIKKFIQKHKKVYVIDRKFHSYFLFKENLIDVIFLSAQEQGFFERPDPKTSIQLDYEKKYFNLKELNEIIPITKHYEHLENTYSYYEDIIKRDYEYQTVNKVLDSYFYVENSPIGVKKSFFDTYTVQFEDFSVKEKTIYTHYNMYNMTGRPTNTFNGVNFLAIPKDKDHRDCIVPTKDYFVEFDFDGYHVRLIANHIGCDLPNTSIHEYLGKLYFSKDSINEDEYKESKIITFKQLYGGVFEEYKHIDVFNKMQSFMDELEKKFINSGYVTLPTGIKLQRNKDITKLKLFNYYVQNLETKVNSDKILKIKNILSDKKTRLCLITYDAFLFDFDKSDGKELLLQIKSVMEEGGYLTKHKHGKNYLL